MVFLDIWPKSSMVNLMVVLDEKVYNIYTIV